MKSATDLFSDLLKTKKRKSLNGSKKREENEENFASLSELKETKDVEKNGELLKR
jgi:hypothetical protein